jgi:hypothetical protein
MPFDSAQGEQQRRRGRNQYGGRHEPKRALAHGYFAPGATPKQYSVPS